MVRKRIKFISEESNRYSTLQEAMDDFIKFKTALEAGIIDLLTQLSNGSPAKFNRPYSNLNTLFYWLVQQNAIEYNPLLLLM